MARLRRGKGEKGRGREQRGREVNQERGERVVRLRKEEEERRASAWSPSGGTTGREGASSATATVAMSLGCQWQWYWGALTGPGGRDWSTSLWCQWRSITIALPVTA